MDDEGRRRFELAGVSTRRIVQQSRTHVTRITGKMRSWVLNAPATTVIGSDRAAIQRGSQRLAFDYRLEHAQSMANALLSHLEGLHLLMQHETFYPVPATPIARAIAEVSASASWVLAAGQDSDTRAARAYASLFHSIHTGAPADPEKAVELRDRVIETLVEDGIKISRRMDKRGKETDDVAQVIVGRGRAKTAFNYSQRLNDEIPSIASAYSGMSGIVHGEMNHLASTWAGPDTYARLVGFVVSEAIEAWSAATHRWVGVTAAPFINEMDLRNLVDSMPPDYLDEFNQL
ncbi:MULTISPECIES: hypothetical protein [unclassified Microbacterium]|uniref:hypothetical protein n=1 Tax=unclassified Microbacterium TaxID=2609290 RepID=UPI0021A962C5|nr:MULTISPECIES: hypothetical protein [unclassified Microbacterium]MCT1364034.1 hypothetical protein [Microbacterium sp. p3-SID131]MCT1375324.1 hypothetical protein [Microbacterium sp. p3-SID337]